MAAQGREAVSPRRYIRLRAEAVGFALGSLCFIVGALPWYADAVGAIATGVTFFTGSLLFTAAGLIQLLLSGRRAPRRGAPAGDRLDWWAAAVQAVGTLLFNISTFVALLAAIAAPDAVGIGWRSNAWGSLAFLVSGVLALAASRRRDELWHIRARTPEAAWLNMAGSVAFGVSAIGAYVVPETTTFVSQLWANLGTVLGGLCFLAAAVLVRPGATAEVAPS
ncbi:hypothetical protein QQX09_00745 [Demequina sp. SYSU T00192]|uniref:YrhK domain-containing protein n=1 Tax=Demequina litoralis TaxID=3051660 RepID=A0ABT8G5G3_9MICO|nr:hypothetical protein [Demequina sp. SYSU T00192]MDN4474375.1 hypothetical protein [Demequina sp. SYSU T00192]